MMKELTIEQIAEVLRSEDNIIILMHKSPDGDAVGSAYGLCLALRAIGKRAEPLCGDEIPRDYEFITEKFEHQEFDPSFVVSVDLATIQLLSGRAAEFADMVDLCIDHHASNTGYAKEGYVDGKKASCAEIVMDVIKALSSGFSKEIADALFTGICTDTGCFKYSSVSPSTHRAAAELMESGADSTGICRRIFDTKSKEKLAMEKMVMETIKYYAGGRIALVCITNEIMEKSGAVQGDTDGIAAMPRQIEGVKIGVTLKEKENGEYRFSVRTGELIDASKICRKFGGGGHWAAAGCSIYADFETAREKMIEACKEALKEHGWTE